MQAERLEAKSHSSGFPFASGEGASAGEAPSPGIARCSDSHAPRSTRRQRSLQKGRKGALAHSSSRPQVGHFTAAGDIACTSGAAGELESDVLLGLSRPGGEAIPREESQIAAMMAAADLGIEAGVGGQED